MGTIYEFIQLKKIEFQSDSNEVLISCEITKNMELSYHHYVVSQTELNKIFGELQANNEGIDLYDLLEKIYINEETQIFSLDFEKNKIQNSWLPDLNFSTIYREIRA
jgi:hypothetical protein